MTKAPRFSTLSSFARRKITGYCRPS
jgi:hypothetical protein